MSFENVSRRDFLGTAAMAVGAAAVASTVGCQQVGTPAPVAAVPAGAPAPVPASAAAQASATVAVKRSIFDQVELGKTGLKCSRLGLGLGSNNGRDQSQMGQQKFNDFIKYAFDQGITLLDTAQAYSTHAMLGEAIKGLPREKLCIQSKIERNQNVLDTIDGYRKIYKTDYVDSMLIHIQISPTWTDTWKRGMDDFNTAHDKGWIKSKGVSCHSLPAVRAAIASEWTQVHLVRVNPQGTRIDNEQQNSWGGNGNPVEPIVAEIKKMHEKGRGIIGMKIFGNGEFRTDADREKSARFVLNLPEVDAFIIGFNGKDQLDKAVKLFSGILAEKV